VSQVVLAEDPEMIQTLAFDSLHPGLGVGIHIGTAGRDVGPATFEVNKR
jgi:hypothetical protein